MNHRMGTVVVLALTVCIGAGAEEVSREAVNQIQVSLDQIVAVSGDMPVERRTVVLSKVNEIRNILANLQPSSAAQDTYRIYDDEEIEDLTARIKAAWPYPSQKIFLQNLAAKARFRMSQIQKIVDVISFANDKKEVLAMILPTVLDPENIDLLFGTFWSASDKEYLNSLLQKKPKV